MARFALILTTFLSNIATWFPSYDVMYYTVTTCNGTLDQEFG